MAVFVLPDAQQDLLELQQYMLATWGESAWLKAEDEIFGKLDQVDNGAFHGTPLPELAAVGIDDYHTVLTSHHRLLYRRIHGDLYVYLIASHKQDFPILWTQRLRRI